MQEKAESDGLSKTNSLRTTGLLSICIQWNMEELRKTKNIYAQRPCQ